MRVVAAAITVGLFLSGTSIASGQSSLGDIARQEAERRKAIRGESRTYTNQDLPEVPARAGADPAAEAPRDADAAVEPEASTETATAVDGPVADSSGDVSRDEAPKDRAYWNGRMTSLRETLERNRTLAEALQSRVSALATDFVNRDDPFQRSAIAGQRDRAVTELERLQKQLIADEEAIAALQTEARRANVPAGWLR